MCGRSILSVVSLEHGKVSRGRHSGLPNTVRKIGKYRDENRRNNDTAFMIGHAYLTLYPSRVFFISSLYTPEIKISN